VCTARPLFTPDFLAVNRAIANFFYLHNLVTMTSSFSVLATHASDIEVKNQITLDKRTWPTGYTQLRATAGFEAWWTTLPYSPLNPNGLPKKMFWDRLGPLQSHTNISPLFPHLIPTTRYRARPLRRSESPSLEDLGRWFTTANVRA